MLDNLYTYTFKRCITQSVKIIKPQPQNHLSMKAVPCEDDFKCGFAVITAFCTQQTEDAVPMLVLCWAIVIDGGPTINQHYFNVCWVRTILGQVINYSIPDKSFRSSNQYLIRFHQFLIK